MIKLTTIQKAPLKNSIIYGQKIAGMQPMALNLDGFVKIDNDLAKKPKEIVTAIKEMVGNYAKHENVSINFKKAPRMSIDFAGSNAARAIEEIANNSVLIEVTPIQTIQTKKPSKISTTLDKNDFSESVRSIYTDIQKITEGLKNKIQYVI